MGKIERDDIEICVITEVLVPFFELMVPDNDLLIRKKMIKMGAIVADNPVGVCFISINPDDSAVLEWIYVEKGFRRQGIAQAMLREYTCYALKRNMNSLTLCIEPPDSVEFRNEGALFLEHMGFFLSWSKGNYALTYKDMISNRRLASLRASSGNITTAQKFFEQSRNVNAVRQFLRNKGIPVSVLDEKEMCLDASFLIKGSDNSITSLLLSSRKGNGMGLDLIVSSSGAEKDILSLFKALYDYIDQFEGKINKLYFCALNPKVDSIIGYFFSKELGTGWERVYGAMYIE